MWKNLLPYKVMRHNNFTRIIHDTSNKRIIIAINAKFEELEIDPGIVLIFNNVISYEKSSLGSINKKEELSPGLLFEKIETDENSKFKLFAFGYLENDSFQIRAEEFRILSKNFFVR